MEETKYGVEPLEDILIHGMRNGLERIYIVYESILSIIGFFIYVIMHIMLGKGSMGMES